MIKKSGLFMVVALLLMANIVTFNVAASGEERLNKEVTVKQRQEEIKAEAEKLNAIADELEKAESDARGGFWAAPTPAERKKIIELKQEKDKLEKNIFDKTTAFFDGIISNPEATDFDKTKAKKNKSGLIETRWDFLRLELRQEIKKQCVWYNNKERINRFREEMARTKKLEIKSN